MILVVAAFTGTQIGTVVHELHGLDPLDHLKPTSFSQRSRSGAPCTVLPLICKTPSPCSPPMLAPTLATSGNQDAGGSLLELLARGVDLVKLCQRLDGAGSYEGNRPMAGSIPGMNRMTNGAAIQCDSR